MQPACQSGGEHQFAPNDFVPDDKDSNEFHSLTCKLCGLIITEPHDFQSSRVEDYRDGGHFIRCRICDEISFQPHVMRYKDGEIPDNEDYNYCTTPGCGYKVLNENKGSAGKSLSLSQRIRSR